MKPEFVLPDDLPLDHEQRTALGLAMKRMLGYRPRVGVIGKTGAGKSSLCNVLFGADAAAVDDVAATTRAPQSLALDLGGHGALTLVDLPGVGENLTRDGEYAGLYARELPRLDALLWLVKADDRSLSVDELFYRDVVAPHLAQGLPCLFVVSQADRMEPVRQWDMSAGQPGPDQRDNLARRADQIAATFGVGPERVRVVSAREGYGLAGLVETLLTALPDEKRVGLFQAVSKPWRSERARSTVRDSVTEVLKRTLDGMSRGAGLGARWGKPGMVLGAIAGAVAGYLEWW